MSLSKVFLHAGVVFFTTACYSQTELKYTIAPWYDNKKAATSITFDDALSGQFTDAMPILDVNNFKGTFFLTTQSLTSQLGSWAPVLKAIRSGHEIANHSVTHPTLINLSDAQVNSEFKNCNDAIFANVKVMPMTMAYPNGSGGGSTTQDQRVRNIAKKYFIGARAAGGNNNEYSFGNVEENYFLVKSPMITDGTSAGNMADMLITTISTGGWFVPTYHGVVNGWIIVSKPLFESHINEFVKRKDDLWVATFGRVLKYHRERKSAKLVEVSEDSKSWVLSLSDTLRNDEVWNQALTLNFEKPSWPIIYISQGGKDIPYTTNGNQITFNVAPDAGNIIIGKEAVLSKDKSNDEESSWSIVPNPIGEIINIVNLEIGRRYNIDIVSPTGDYSKQIEITAKDVQFSLSSKELKQGLYIITIEGISKKVVIQ